MRVIFYAAITANGMTAKTDGNTDWVSPEDFRSFSTTCQKIGSIVMGRRTFQEYQTLPPQQYPLPDGLTIVLSTTRPDLSLPGRNVRVVAEGPSGAVKIITASGLSQTCVVGGHTTWASFAKEGLVDEIYLDIEPYLFGQGMPLFLPADFEYHLKLIETKNLNSQTLQLHYRVEK